MNYYYAQRLSAKRLERCYNIAPERVKQYLKAEIDFVCERIKKTDSVLELGCGYGRIFPELMNNVKRIVGIDNSYLNIEYGKQIFGGNKKIQFLQMDAGELGFQNKSFNTVLCIQNGLSAFKVEMQKLIKGAIRITKPGGQAFFSTYSEKFWQHRLEWFKIQSEQGIIGEIDYDQTGDGVIVCKDGFKAVTISRDDFTRLTMNLNLKSEIIEVDNSSLFCVVTAE
jgi:2-polyprenyl-6-hydroxyphenyl methylase/3-demethylubiquinone-9 3-methyltransferase